TIADLFVLCSGRSERQVQAIADAIVEKAKEAGRQPFGIEGYSGGRWVLIDLGDVVVHAFVPEDRQLYRLERLWGDAPVVLHIAFIRSAEASQRGSRAEAARPARGAAVRGHGPAGCVLPPGRSAATGRARRCSRDGRAHALVRAALSYRPRGGAGVEPGLHP